MDFKAPLFWGAGAAVVVTAASVLAASLLDAAAVMPLAAFGLLLAVTLFTTAWLVGLRLEVWRAEKQTREASGKDLPAREELARFGGLGAPVVQVLGALVGLGFSLLPLGDVVQAGLAASVPAAAGGSVYPPPTYLFVAGGLAWVVAFPLLVFGRALTRVEAERLPEAAGLSLWLRGGQWIALFTGLALILDGLRLTPWPLGRAVAAALLVLVALAALELALRAAARFFRPRAAWAEVIAPVELTCLAALFRGRNPVDSLLEVAENRLGFTLRTAWAMGFLRRSFPVLVLFMGLILWLSTALVVVQPYEQGVRLRFGRLVSRAPVGPGLAWKLPWPLESIERYPTRRVQTLSLGYAGRVREALLWTQAHTGVEYKMLLGDGRELVSVDADVSYRIRDVVAFALNHQNPCDVVEAVAYRLLTETIVVTSLDHLLSVNRDRFATEFTRGLQRASDTAGLGLEILHTTFMGLHPPVKIAPEYQAVVGAQIEQETAVIRAEVERAQDLPLARAEATGAVLGAQGDAVTLEADATGAVTRFTVTLEAYEADPDLFTFRRWLEALEQGLTAAGVDLYILDHGLEQEHEGAGEYWLDLRTGSRRP